MNKFDLISGEDFITSNGIVVKHPRLEDVKEFGDLKYRSFINIFCIQPYELMVDLWESGIDFEQITQFELFLMLYNSRKKEYDEMFEHLMGLKHMNIGSVEKTEELAIEGRSVSKNDFFFLINEKVFNEISQYFSTIHCFSKDKKPPKFKNENTKKMYIQVQKNLTDEKKQDEDSMVNLISALVWGNNGAVNWDNVWDLHIYQFYDGLKRINKIKEYDNVMNGIYHGTIESSKVNMKDINWLSD